MKRYITCYMKRYMKRPCNASRARQNYRVQNVTERLSYLRRSVISKKDSRSQGVSPRETPFRPDHG